MIRAKDSVEQLAPYVAPLEGRRGMLRLDFNENTVGPSPKVVEAIRAIPAEEYAIYPEYDPLHEAAARFLGVSRPQLGLFNGADAAIRAIFDAFGEEGSAFLTTSPTFGYYAPCAAQQGMALVAVPYEEDLSFPLAGLRRELERGPRILFVCNPNNPTGTLASADVLLALADAYPETLLVVDELYATFTGVTVLPGALDRRNVIVLRSLSKSAGLAALRLGFALAAPDLVDRLNRVTGPYDINAFAVRAGLAAIEDDAHVQRYVEAVREAKALTLRELSSRGVRHFADGGNYLLVWPPGELEAVVAGLRERGILVRSMAKKPLIDGSFRLTVGTREQMIRFFAAFDAVLGAPRASAASRDE
jgi:histidinol-phosphate aminotransferase